MLRMQNKAAGLLVALALVASACGGSGGDAAAFCDLRDQFGQQGDFLAMGPDEAAPAVAEVRRLLSDASDAAPEEIKESFDTAADAFIDLIDVFEDAEFGAAATDQAALEAALQALSTPEIAAANGEVEQWYADNCPAE